MPQPTSPSRRRVLLAVAAVVVVALAIATPIILGALARGAIVDAIAERGFTASLERVRATPTGRLRARNVCIEPIAAGEGPAACVERMSVRARVRGLRASRVQVRSVDVNGGRVDVPLEWLETFVRQHRSAPDDRGAGGRSRARLFDELDGLTVRELELTFPGPPSGQGRAAGTAGARSFDGEGGAATGAGDGAGAGDGSFAGAGGSGDGTVGRLVIEELELLPFDSGAVDVLATIRLAGVHAAARQRVAGLDLPDTLRVSLRRSADGAFSEASIEGDQPVRLVHEDTAELAVARVRFDAPVAVVFEDVVARVGVTDEQVRVTAQRLRAEVGEWTLDPRELYLTSLEAVELSATADLDRSLRPRALAHLRADRRRAGDRGGDEGASDPEDTDGRGDADGPDGATARTNTRPTGASARGAAAGDAAAGDAAAGDAAAGDAVAGDAAAGDAVAGDAVAGDAVAGDAVAGDAGSEAGGDGPGSDGSDDDGHASAPANDRDTRPDERSWRDRMLAELARRQWWEILPRRIQLRDSRLAARGFDDDGDAGPLLRLESATLDYAIRVINTQLDVQLQAELALDDTPAGGVRLEATWNYDRGALDATVELDAVHARALEALRGLPVVDLEGGTLTGSTRLAGRVRDGLTSEGSMRLADGVVSTRLLDEPLQLDDLLVTWTVAQRLRRDGSGRSDVAFERFDLRLRGAEASLTPTLHGLRRGATPPLERVDVRLHVPEQDATLLFEAIPATLRGPLTGTVMRGTYGVTLAFPITWLPTRGGFDVEVGGATDLELLDDRLELVSLPHDVDVRRLNGPMTFTFRGPNDAINRSIRLAPPRWIAGPYPTVEADLAGVTPANWVRLNEMSYYLVATQLYREDGSFFRNHGINWTQMRRVIGDAIRRGELGRGASTITMQTVKNVFLSHERSLERKLQELFLTYWMARTVPRERILEVYMNIIEWGPSQNGAQEASRFYFGTPVEVLGIRESVWLSMITPSPIRMGNGRPRGAVLPGQCQRCDQLIGQLHARGWISRTEMDMGLGNGSIPTALPGSDGASAGGPGSANAGGGGLLAAPSEGPGVAIAALPIAQRIAHQARTGLSPRGAGPAPRTGAAARRHP